MLLCRLCSSKEQILDVFHSHLTHGYGQQLRLSIFLATGIEIKQSDLVSKLVCRRCCGIAVKLHKYRTNAVTNDKLLKEQCGQPYTPPIINQEEILRLAAKIVSVQVNYHSKNGYESSDSNLNSSSLQMLNRSCETSETHSQSKNSLITDKSDPNKYSSINKLHREYENIVLPEEVLQSDISPVISLNSGEVKDWYAEQANCIQNRLTGLVVKKIPTATALTADTCKCCVIPENDVVKTDAAPVPSSTIDTSCNDIITDNGSDDMDTSDSVSYCQNENDASPINIPPNTSLDHAKPPIPTIDLVSRKPKEDLGRKPLIERKRCLSDDEDESIPEKTITKVPNKVPKNFVNKIALPNQLLNNETHHENIFRANSGLPGGRSRSINSVISAVPPLVESTVVPSALPAPSVILSASSSEIDPNGVLLEHTNRYENIFRANLELHGIHPRSTNSVISVLPPLVESTVVPSALPAPSVVLSASLSEIAPNELLLEHADCYENIFRANSELPGGLSRSTNSVISAVPPLVESTVVPSALPAPSAVLNASSSEIDPNGVLLEHANRYENRFSTNLELPGIHPRSTNSVISALPPLVESTVVPSALPAPSIALSTSSSEIDPNGLLLEHADREHIMVAQRSLSVFFCSVCNKVFDSRKQLKDHERVHLKCKLCKLRVKSIRSLNKHLKESCFINIIKNPPNLKLTKVEYIPEAVENYPEAFEELFTVRVGSSDLEEDGFTIKIETDCNVTKDSIINYNRTQNIFDNPINEVSRVEVVCRLVDDNDGVGCTEIPRCPSVENPSFNLPVSINEKDNRSDSAVTGANRALSVSAMKDNENSGGSLPTSSSSLDQREMLRSLFMKHYSPVDSINESQPDIFPKNEIWSTGTNTIRLNNFVSELHKHKILVHFEHDSIIFAEYQKESSTTFRTLESWADKEVIDIAKKSHSYNGLRSVFRTNGSISQPNQNIPQPHIKLILNAKQSGSSNSNENAFTIVTSSEAVNGGNSNITQIPTSIPSFVKRVVAPTTSGRSLLKPKPTVNATHLVPYQTLIVPQGNFLGVVQSDQQNEKINDDSNNVNTKYVALTPQNIVQQLPPLVYSNNLATAIYQPTMQIFQATMQPTLASSSAQPTRTAVVRNADLLKRMGSQFKQFRLVNRSLTAHKTQQRLNHKIKKLFR